MTSELCLNKWVEAGILEIVGFIKTRNPTTADLCFQYLSQFHSFRSLKLTKVLRTAETSSQHDGTDIGMPASIRLFVYVCFI
jgi:hypothetical protein